MTVLIQCPKHLKPLAMIQLPLVVEQEAKGPIFDCRVDQTLPETTCLQIGCIGDEERVQSLGRVVGQPKVVLDELVMIKVTF
jgi:hypothetical protein